MYAVVLLNYVRVTSFKEKSCKIKTSKNELIVKFYYRYKYIKLYIKITP